MKKKIFEYYLFLLHFLIYFSCITNSPKICSYLIKYSLFRKKSFKQKTKNKRVSIILYRSIGDRDIEIVENLSNKIPELFFMSRSITKLIFYYFHRDDNKFFFNYANPGTKPHEYFAQKKGNKKKHEKFWTEVIYNLKKQFSNKTLNFITFNFSYYAENALYVGCKNNNVFVKLWFKECFRSESEINHLINSNKFTHFLKLFHRISVYNKTMKQTLMAIDSDVGKKTSVNGCPRILDFINNKRYNKKIKDILFLTFSKKRGIPKYKENKNYNWDLSFQKVIDILNELSENQKINIKIKTKKNTARQLKKKKINKNIEVFYSGTSSKLINQADIIIAQNSAASIEALINGKHVIIPFFEKKTYKKFLYKFNNKIIFTSEKKIKENILNLIDRKVSFPLKNKDHENTIKYYYGDSKNIIKNYENFLNS